jgi:hypothetical protein
MKQLFLLLLLSSVLSYSQTNVYHPFPLENVFWNVQKGVLWSSVSGCTCDHSNIFITYFFNGDTLANGKVFQKMYNNVHITSYGQGMYPALCNCDGPTFLNQFVGGIRNDTINKKVYLYRDSAEYVLYDFNLSVGDTAFKDSSIFTYGQNALVSSIDSIMVGNSFRKKYNLLGTECNSVYMIEGIGLSFGPIDFATCFEDASYLTCFSNDSITFSTTNWSGQCEFVGIEHPIKLTSFKLYPNPTSGNFKIDMERRMYNAEFKMYDQLGREVKSMRNINGNSIQIENSALPRGIYKINIVESNKVILSQKLILE